VPFGAVPSHAQEAAVYAVIATGGKQYRVTPGDEIEVEKVSGDVGETIDLRAVLVVGEDGAVTVGPDVEGHTVPATITEHGRGPKIRVFTYKNKTRQRRHLGHRQPYTRLRIESVPSD
jgi:large subunit ribosomal protein L21